ncbi:MAG: hypothetical protein HQ538_01585 [Parcubacteria group bacterium]|nr:hypothetical protein [Parcubacteria group bacterium]
MVYVIKNKDFDIVKDPFENLSYNDIFGVDNIAGNANNVIQGNVIRCVAGYIGGVDGWEITSGLLKASGLGFATQLGNATYAFWAGDDDPTVAEFSIKHTGALKAVSAVFGATNGTLTVGGVNGLFEIASDGETDPCFYAANDTADTNDIFLIQQKGTGHSIYAQSITDSAGHNPVGYFEQKGTGAGGNAIFAYLNNSSGTAAALKVLTTGTIAANIRQSATTDLPVLQIQSSTNGGPHIGFEATFGDPSPTSADGDFWFDGTDLKINVGGTVYTLDKSAV